MLYPKKAKKRLQKQRRRAQLNQNKMQGKFAEYNFVTSAKMRGHRVKRKPYGSDYEIQKTDFFGRPKGKKRLVEVKSGKAKLSKLQKKTKKKNKGKYKVVRY
jgi:hypothetical protein